MGNRKIVHVAPVIGHGKPGGAVFEMVAKQRVLAGPGRAEYENVIAEAMEIGSELDRLDRALLTDKARKVFQLVRGAEAELPGIAAVIKIGNGERFYRFVHIMLDYRPLPNA